MKFLKRLFKRNKDSYSINNKENLLQLKKVAVVVPVYNAEKFLKKTIESVINQSIGLDSIQLILVDDGSTDNSRKILKDYAKKYKEITVVFLNKNTGGPAGPRNLGIELSNSEYITFIDADDWFEIDGLEKLYSIIKETGDDYIVGKTIEVKNGTSRIVGKQESCKERRSIDPFEINDIFKHLGPRARMVKSSIIKDNNIKFPHMKFAEDKQFFMDVLLQCKKISTTKDIIYYLNRNDENDTSLTKQTNTLQKMDTNIKVINYIKSKNLPIEKERIILNRLYEYDCITRLFNRKAFLESKNKEQFYKKYQEILDTTKDLRYDFTEDIKSEINYKINELFNEGKYNSIIKLIKYSRLKDRSKQTYEIIDNKPYLVADFLEDNHKNIPMNMFAVYKDSYIKNNKYIIEIQAYGNFLDNIDSFIIEKRCNEYSEDNVHYYEFEREGNNIKVELDLEKLALFESTTYKVFFRYNGHYQLLIYNNGKKIGKEKENVQLYTTINSNIGLKIK